MNLKFQLFIACYFLFLGINTGQSLDSMYAVYYAINENDRAQKIELLQQLINRETHQTPTKALLLNDTLAELHRQNNNIEAYNKVRFYNKGFVYATMHNSVEALKYYQEYAKIFTKTTIADAYFLIDVGNLYYTLKLFNMAKRCYRDAEIIFQNEQFHRGLTTVYSNFALIAKNQNQLDTAFFYAYKTLKIQEEFSRDTFQIAHTYQVIGRLNLEVKKDYPAAIAAFQKSIDLLSDERLITYFHYQQFIHLLPLDYMYIGRCFAAIGQVNTAHLAFDKAIKNGRTIKQGNILAAVLVGVGEELLLQKAYLPAQAYLKEAETLCVEQKNYTTLLKCYKALKDLAEQTKDYPAALLYWNKYNDEKDRFKNEEDKFLVMNDEILQQERINTIENQQNLLLVDEKLRNRLYIILALTGLGFGLFVVFWWNLRKKIN